MALFTGHAIAAPNTSLDVPLIVTETPLVASAGAAGWDATRLARGDQLDGGRIVLVPPSGEMRVLSAGFESACDPNVSFDGQRVLFAGRKDRAAGWRIWEIGVDGTGLHPITPETLEARSPIYVSTLFTLNSPQPWETLVFVGRKPGASGAESTTSLYDIKLDGGELRRLTFSPHDNLDPVQMWDGRVVYAAGRQAVEGPTGPGRLGLFAIHIEGADMEAYGGELGLPAQQMPCPTAGGLVVFIESDHASWDGGGQLGWVEQQRPHRTHHALPKAGGFVYRYPTPWQQNEVLVSQRDAHRQGRWAIVRFNADTGALAPVFASNGHHVVQAVALRPRRAPDGHSTVVTTADDRGALYGLDCYTTDAARTGQLRPGEVKRVRVVEGVGAASRRLIGEAPVESDGSFNLVVPADTPLLLQTLDDSGLALGTCGWIWVKPKENRGCIGCHEDPERVPENTYVLALHREPNQLVPAPAERRSVTFSRDVAPILQAHAGELRDARGRPLRLALATPTAQSDAYRTLTQGPQALVHPGRARTSPLIWQLTGRNTSRPWDETPKANSKKAAAPATAAIPLSADDLRTVILWIDLGAAFDAPAPVASPQDTATK